MFWPMWYLTTLNPKVHVHFYLNFYVERKKYIISLQIIAFAKSTNDGPKEKKVDIEHLAN